MTGSQIRRRLSEIIDSLAQEVETRDEAVDTLIKIIENYREDL